MKAPTEDTDSYLALVPEPARGGLEDLRRVVLKTAAPLATETISYGMPTLKHEGLLVAFAAFKHHCSLLVMSRAVMAAFADELEQYDTSPGTIRFRPDQPLPADLVTRLVQARVAENEFRTAAGKARRSRVAHP
jgi:uncharacterized protein YdhG (YjbR/CyaY superfamily)